MCLILFSLQSHPDYPLIVAANRDEFFQRPTAAAEFWQDQSDLLAGRDLQAGGTWLGVNKNGRFAAVTNVRKGGEPQDKPGSRGALVTQALLQDSATALTEIRNNQDHYNGFNLLCGTPESLFYLSNSDHYQGEFSLQKNAQPQPLEAGIYGLSNAALNTSWPKVDSAKAEMQRLIEEHASNPETLQTALMEMMANDQRAADDQLPNTGIGQEWESLLSSRFIVSPEYGTRATTIVLFHRNGLVDFVEQGFDHQQPLERRNFSFQR